MAAISRTPMSIVMTQNPPQIPVMDQNPQNPFQTPVHPAGIDMARPIVSMKADKTRRMTPMSLRFPIARIEKRASFALAVPRSSMASGVSRLGIIYSLNFSELVVHNCMQGVSPQLS